MKWFSRYELVHPLLKQAMLYTWAPHCFKHLFPALLLSQFLFSPPLLVMIWPLWHFGFTISRNFLDWSKSRLSSLVLFTCYRYSTIFCFVAAVHVCIPSYCSAASIVASCCCCCCFFIFCRIFSSKFFWNSFRVPSKMRILAFWFWTVCFRAWFSAACF